MLLFPYISPSPPLSIKQLSFKKKKKTRGMLAIERGLEALANFMMENNDSAIEKEAEKSIKKPRTLGYGVFNVKGNYS